MPIEDVDYLLEHSEKDSITLFVDSSTRDKTSYPDPATYVIEFTEPIKNVYGIDVLDASIPVSMYNIDLHNNVFAFTQVFLSTGFNDHDFEIYFEELQDNSVFTTIFNANADGDLLICNQDSPGAAQFDMMQQDTERIVNTMSSMAYMKRNIIVDTGIVLTDLSLEQAGLFTEAIPFTYAGKVYMVNALLPAATIIQTYKDFTIVNDSILVYYDVIKINAEELQMLVASMADQISYLVDMHINSNYVYLEIGNYDSTSLLQYLGSILKVSAALRNSQSLITSKVPILPTQINKHGSFDKTLRFKFVSKDRHPFIFDMEKSTCDDALGFATFTQQSIPNYYKMLKHRTNKKLFMSIAGGTEFEVTQTIVAPNIVNLMGIRYILLRCPEIENHLLGSFAYGKFSPGLGMFKLAAGMDITNLRFDFVSMIKKPFHPIGKLSRLTLSFETKTGDVYDFKGVDHNMMICIKFYTPRIAKRAPMSLLNPNYNPDYLEYAVQRMMLEKQAESDSSEEDEAEFQNFLSQQKKYQYDSD
jgi:hypothetical protein